MLERDYLLGQIEQLAAFLAQVVLRRRAGQPVDDRELDAAIQSLVGLPLDAVLSLPLPALLATLEPAGDPTWTRTRLLARLLAERGDADGAAPHRRAFLLLDEVSRRTPTALAEEDEAALATLVQRLG